MKRLIFCLFLFICIQVSGQNSLNDLNVIHKHNFENNTLGDYLIDEWKRDWLYPTWQTRLSEAVIVKDNSNTENPTKTLQINFPANSLGPDEGGVQWFTNISKQEEIYVSYDIMFMPGFKFQLGGKLPSVQGGKYSGPGAPSGYDGFSGGLSFDDEGALRFYIYYPDQASAYGQTFTWGANYRRDQFLPSKVIVEYASGSVVKLKPGTWNNITYRMVLNTVKSTGGGNYDGILEAYFNGKLVLQLSHLLFRHTTALGVNVMRIYSFFGGDTDECRNPIAEWLKIDNVILYTFKDNVNVPRGNKLSEPNRTINYWRLISSVPTNPPGTPTSLVAGTRDKTSIGLKWTDNASNEQGFKIYRSLSATAGFVEIGAVSANVTSFTDKSLQPGTKYYYRVRAYNIAGNSSYSAVLATSTLALQIPAVPTSLISTAQTKNSITLNWTDNANNEQEFKIFRSLSATSGFSEIARVTANITTYVDNSLQPGTTYYYKVNAHNQDGSSAYTSVTPATTIPLQLPGAPTALIASQIDFTLAKILWTDNSNNETGFDLERRGPNDFTSSNTTTITLPANCVSFKDTMLNMNSTYQYRIRARNDDGVSAWSNVIEVVTPTMFPPSAPTNLKNTKITDKSVSVCWRDNSDNEDGFVISRSLANDEISVVDLKINANDTAFTDTSLISGTTYQYTVKAINMGGCSSLSNKNVATTLSQAELKRVKDGLIAYYNFGLNPDYIVYDQSGFSEPVNLRVLNRSAVRWNENNSIDILSNTALVSMTPATKIIQALKKSNELTFECWVKPREPDFTTGSRIISVGNDDDDVGFLLDQNITENPENRCLTYSIRLQTESTNSSGYPEFIPDRTQSYVNLQHLVYVRDSVGKEIMFLNGIKSSEGFRPSNLGNWKNDFYLRLGNESDMSHFWKGRYYSVAIYNKALSIDEIMTNYSAGPCDSITNSSAQYTVELYPNPVADHAFIKITPEEITDFVPQTMIRIINKHGEVVHQESVFNPTNQFSKDLDIRKYPKGFYLLQVIFGENQKSLKLIVQ